MGALRSFREMRGSRTSWSWRRRGDPHDQEGQSVWKRGRDTSNNGMAQGYTALICARGGSKGVPHKNIRPLNGKPLISWAIERASRVKGISRVIVSTDSEEIARVS